MRKAPAVQIAVPRRYLQVAACVIADNSDVPHFAVIEGATAAADIAAVAAVNISKCDAWRPAPKPTGGDIGPKLVDAGRSKKTADIGGNVRYDGFYHVSHFKSRVHAARRR
jgi:hypothetical protein